MPFSFRPRANSSKSLLISCSFTLFFVEAKFNPFSSIRISVSVKAFRLKLKTASQQEYPSERLFLVTPCLEYAKEVLMFSRDSKGIVLFCGAKAVGCLELNQYYWRDYWQ